jgi:hypothetical protein
MKCLICNSETEYFFSKTYEEEPFDGFMEEIGEIAYYKCVNCGFTISKTHCELSNKQWEKLNYEYHTYNESAQTSNERQVNPPPYLEQAVMIKILSDNGIIDRSSMLDFAGGYGRLSNILNRYFGITLYVYDPYVQTPERNIYTPKQNLSKYKTVVNSAMFEHITTRNTLEELNDCVDNDGCMIVHTVIGENVPHDADWFYLRPPVHCAFHTNKSMEILMKQWGYSVSIYCPTSKCWVLLRKGTKHIEKKIKSINMEFQKEYLYFKKGFMDYWKEA